MKLYTRDKDDIIRLTFRKAAQPFEYIMVHECTLEEVKILVSDILKPHLSVFGTGKRTAIDFREYLGATAGKSTSISFYGLTPKEAKEIILNSLQS